MAKKALLCITLLLVIIVLTGCNTVHGIGKDVESAGHAIERSSGK